MATTNELSQSIDELSESVDAAVAERDHLHRRVQELETAMLVIAGWDYDGPSTADCIRRFAKLHTPGRA